ncbi:hypothetical protein ILUMI_03755 [Ignelater luminosus]|uniref:Uncharacterized protein n=1 Tax=Ignelater luminosus TaxID=2038154 RepID=A0A8K0DF72_IGNLU|nr:hypothetical protein ILUMI_03755 [Ignelater luminosus]
MPAPRAITDNEEDTPGSCSSDEDLSKSEDRGKKSVCVISTMRNLQETAKVLRTQAWSRTKLKFASGRVAAILASLGAGFWWPTRVLYMPNSAAMTFSRVPYSGSSITTMLLDQKVVARGLNKHHVQPPRDDKSA